MSTTSVSPWNEGLTELAKTIVWYPGFDNSLEFTKILASPKSRKKMLAKSGGPEKNAGQV